MTIFGVKCSIFFCKLTHIFSSLVQKENICKIVIFVATKKGRTRNYFHSSLLLLFLVPGSGMDKNQDPGSGINISDQQHCLLYLLDS
jgi:hypothetical protein